MSSNPSPDSPRLGRLLLRLASLLVPHPDRQEWLREWEGEIWHLSHANGVQVRFCLGAFKDAAWLRRNTPVRERLRSEWLSSPVRCIALLSSLAAVSLSLSFRLPGPHDALWREPFRDEGCLVLLSGHVPDSRTEPSVSFEQYREIERRLPSGFTELAFYHSALQAVTTERRERIPIRIAFASEKIFNLLHVPMLSEPAGSKLLLSAAAWHIQDESQFAAIEPGSKGFVIGRLKSPGPLHRNTPLGRSAFHCEPLVERRPMLGQLFILGVALFILPTFTRLALGDYPAKTCSRRWIFLVLKVALVLLVVFFGTIDLAPGMGSIQPLAALIGYTLGFRWILTDQRQRCPVCLRLLSNPAKIGQPSSTLLEWYGTELMCARGHGLLHVSEASTISFGSQQWMDLDQTWQHLF